MKHHSITAQEDPDKPAIIMGQGDCVSYGDFRRQANQLCHYFRSVGLKANEHVAVFMENNPTYLVFMMAAIDCGLNVTPISVFLQPEEIEYVVNNCEAKLLLVSSQYAAFAEEIAGKTPHVEHFLMLGGAAPGYEDYERVVSQMPVEAVEYGAAGHFMFYSSGTTGRPKGIAYKGRERHVLEDDPLLAGVRMVLRLSADTVYLSPAPLYHSAPAAGCITGLLSGATIVVMEHFDPEQALALIDRYKATSTQWVPTMFVRLLKLPEAVRRRYDCSSIEAAVHAAAPCSPETKEAMIAWWGDAVVEYWGASEVGVITVITAQEALKRRGSVGRAVRGKIHILDDRQEEVPSGEVGLIFVHTEQTFEYYGEPEKTASSTSKQGWQSIGDTGYLDEDGYLYLSGRKSHMIISGGVNIYPEETENLLVGHPKIMDVAVIGVPNEEFGEEVKAIVQLVDGVDPTPEVEAELINFCRAQVSHVKCPRSVDFVSKLARTPTGKLRKHEIRAPYWQGTGRSI